MYFSNFLALRNLTLEQILAVAPSAGAIGQHDILFVVGSLAEGIGSTTSDIDFILLTPRLCRVVDDEEHLAWIAGNCVIDMRVLPIKEWVALYERFARWSNVDWALTHAPRFTVAERTLLYRIATGQRVDHNDLNAIVPEFPSLAELSKLKLQVARQDSRTVQVDMRGLYDAGDWRSLGMAAQQLLGLAVDALLAGHHIANPLLKWRSRLLERVPSDWAMSACPGFADMNITDLVWSLSRLPESPNSNTVTWFAHRAAAFARSVFIWSESALLGINGGLDIARHLHTKASEAIGFLDFDVDFQLSEDFLYLARLNNFAEPLILGADAIGAITLFDGLTTPDQADKNVFRGQKGTMRELVRRCDLLGLLAAPIISHA